MKGTNMTKVAMKMKGMIFSELYSAYYNTVAAILKVAVNKPLQTKDFYRMIEKHAFGESMLNILPAIQEERWQFIKSDGTTPLKNMPSMPLTTLEKRWLKAIANDPRIHLFLDHPLDFPDVEPLFLPEDILIFDQYADGDDYENETYIYHFRLILDAIKHTYPLQIQLKNRKGNLVNKVILPEYLEYSEKDDKFRLIGTQKECNVTINLGRIISCKPYDKPYDKLSIKSPKKRNPESHRQVIFELTDQRKSLERVLLHFAHFEKEAEKLDTNHYRITIIYDKEDETEMVIRILSFGPMIKVTAPQHFVEKIKQRLLHQKSCEP